MSTAPETASPNGKREPKLPRFEARGDDLVVIYDALLAQAEVLRAEAEEVEDDITRLELYEALAHLERRTTELAERVGRSIPEGTRRNPSALINLGMRAVNSVSHRP